jgi:hypothetical protein
MVEDRHARIKGTAERRANGRKLVNGAATANGVFRVLRALWNFAADRDDTLGRNPVGRLKDQWCPVPTREGLVKGDQLADFYRVDHPAKRYFLFRRTSKKAAIAGPRRPGERG